jgi:hypothetical protein
MKGGTVEASKFTALTKLYAIRDNSYRGYHNKSGEVKDYDKESVDKLIWAKESKQAQKNTDKELKDQDLYADFLRATPLDKMTYQQYEDFYFLENGKLPWSADCDEGFKKAVLSLAIQRASGTDKTPKKRAAIKKPLKVKTVAPVNFDDLDIDQQTINHQLDQLEAANNESDLDTYLTLKSKIKENLKATIYSMRHRNNLWGEIDAFKRDMKVLHEQMERFTNSKISKFRDTEHIEIYITKEYLEHIHAMNLEEHIQETAYNALGLTGHSIHLESSYSHDSTYELDGKRCVELYRVYRGIGFYFFCDFDRNTLLDNYCC